MVNPKFIAIAAITLDGRIAKGQKHMSDWTSKEDKVFMRALLDQCDLVIVGNNTYQTAIKPLSKRNCLVFTHSLPPLPLGEGRGEGVFKKSDKLIYADPNKTNVKKLTAKLKYKKIAILGGAQTYAYCLKNNLLDELYLTIEPLVFGAGISLFGDTVLNNPSRRGRAEADKFKLVSIKKLNNKGSVLLKYVK